MSLDLIIRGAGSSRSPGEHLNTLAAEYGDARILLYGEHGLTGVPQAATTILAKPAALTEAIKAAGDAQVLVYGDESLLALAQELQPGLIWITLGSDANGVREIWRIRQQHSWLSSKKLALLIEQLPENPQPDTERLMRLSRATRALLVGTDEAATTSAPVEPEAEPAVTEPAVAQAAHAEAEVAVAAQPALEPEVQAEPETEPVAPAASPEPELETTAEPVAAAEPEATIAPAAGPDLTTEAKGADFGMETTSLNHVAEKTAGNAQEALIQRYALVKERRSTTQRIGQVEESMQNLLKEIFVSRFAAGPEAAAAFEALTRKLTDASSEFTQLSRTLANLEQQLAKLAWVKDELEI